MTSQQLRLLTATTAIMAAASGAAMADDISGTQTTPVQTSAIVAGPTNISGSAIISVTTGAAIEISASTASNTINISSSATVRSSATSGTIQIMPNQVGAVTINNSGTIQALGSNTSAISSTAGNVTGAITINNTGTISGTVTTSETADFLNNSGTMSGNVDMSAGVDTVSNTGTITGNLALGAGADVLNATGGTITGNVTGASGTDVITLGTAGRVNGNIVLGASEVEVDTLNISGTGVVSGTIAGGGGADRVNISNSTAGFTTLGNITEVENLNISNSVVNLRHGMDAFLTNVRADLSSTLNVSESLVLAASSGVTTSGTVNLAAGKSVNSTNFNFNSGKLGMTVQNSTTASQLIVKNAGNGAFTAIDGSLTIAIAPTSGYIASGTQYQLVFGDAANSNAAVLPSLTTTSSGLYTFSIAQSGTGNRDISLTVLRAAANTLAQNGANSAIGAAIEGISTTTNAQLVSVHGLLGAQTSTAGVNNVLDQLNPANTTGAAVASVNVSTQTGNQVSNRLSMLRGGNGGMNTGDGTFTNHFWMQAFGNMSEQDDKDGFKGYDANTVGGSVGIDTDTMVDGMTTGLAFSYGQSAVESNASGNAETDIGSYQLTGYGSKVLNGGVFVNGQLSAGLNKYESTRNVLGLGTANGEFDGMQYGAKVEAGKDFAWNCLTLTPLASAQYTYLDMDKYTETGLGGANNIVDSKSYNALDLGLGGQVAWDMPMADGGTLKPMLRAKYIYRAGDDSVESNTRFVGGGAAFNTQGVEADRSSVNLGTGVLLSTMGGMDLSVDYDADLRSSYTGHTGQLKARWAF